MIPERGLLPSHWHQMHASCYDRPHACLVEFFFTDTVLWSLSQCISGAFKPGVLNALMGASGAGKTTLMDVLADRKTGAPANAKALNAQQRVCSASICNTYAMQCTSFGAIASYQCCSAAGGQSSFRTIYDVIMCFEHDICCNNIIIMCLSDVS